MVKNVQFGFRMQNGGQSIQKPDSKCVRKWPFENQMVRILDVDCIWIKDHLPVQIVFYSGHKI
jgi:hypothetical protein